MRNTLKYKNIAFRGLRVYLLEFPYQCPYGKRSLSAAALTLFERLAESKLPNAPLLTRDDGEA